MDSRTIEGIEDYKKNALILVQEMKPVTFKKKGQVKKELGIVSQELQVLEPLSVNVNGQNILSVDYESLTILLVKAIQELKAELDDLKGKKKK